MVKIGMLLPEERMVEPARKIIEENHLDVVYLEAVHTVDAVNKARIAVETGAHILVARGYQAKLIKEYTNIPVVEIRFHAQEIGLLIQKAKTILKKEHPHIALIAFENMLCDMSYMEQLFDIRLDVIYLKRIEEAESIIADFEERPDLIIGGEGTCRAAETMGYSTLFYQSTGESLKEALLAAKNASYAAESEKRNTAQFETVLDTSFNGIIKVNAEGKVIVVNKLVENLLGKNSEDLVGKSLTEILPGIDSLLIENILSGKSESYSTSVSVRKKTWMAMIAPIQYDNQITGAILSLQKLADNSKKTKDIQGDMLLHGFAAQTKFEDIQTENAQMRKMLETAKMYALSEHAVMIYGQAGTEDYLLAEAIHNNSIRKVDPYVSINMRGMDKEHQMEELFRREAGDTVSTFGAKGAMIKANHGTLFIKGIEHLTLRVQHQILRTMLSRAQMRTDAQPLDTLNVRIIGSSKINLKHLVEKGEFSEELYYMLQSLVLEIPSLNERPEDLRNCFDKELKIYKEKYNRPLSVTEGAYKKLQELKWTGNGIQLRSFCERLVLTAKKRMIDEVVLQNLYDELFPHVEESHGEKRILVYRSQETDELEELLERFHGNRKLVAEELGISTTTLWRRMKKYGIEANYGGNELL